MIPLDKQRAMDKVIGTGKTNWRVSIRHEDRETTYTCDALPTLTPMNALGEVLLKETWYDAEHVLLPLTLSIAAAGVLVGAQMGLHALVAVKRSLRSARMHSTRSRLV